MILIRSGMHRLMTLPRHALMTLVRIYRMLSSGQPASCRFEPTCSAYALAVLERHGAAAGTFFAVHRVLRCGPWCSGGQDPVPLAPPRAFRFLARDSSSPDASASSQTSAFPP